MQIIGVGHDEREEKAERVYPTVGQTEGLSIVIGVGNKKASVGADRGVILQNHYTTRGYNEQEYVDSTNKRKLLNTCN